jgi:hypothetical protein
VVGIPAAFGLFLLLSSEHRLFACVRWLPLPKKGTSLYTVLLTFWRVIGAMALLFALWGAYIIWLR